MEMNGEQIRDTVASLFDAIDAARGVKNSHVVEVVLSSDGRACLDLWRSNPSLRASIPVSDDVISRINSMSFRVVASQVESWRIVIAGNLV